MPDDQNRVKIGDRVTLRRRGKKKTYVAEFFFNGQHRRVSMKTANLSVAKARALKLAAELVDGKYRPPPKALPYATGVNDYLKSLTANHKAEDTIKMYRRVLNAFGLVLAAARVNTIGQMIAAHFDLFLIELSGKVGATTRAQHAMIVKQFAKWLTKRKLIVENPFSEIPVYKPAREPKERPNLDQLNQLFCVAEDWLKPWLMVLSFAGLRAGELRRIRREDVDLSGNWLHVVSRPGAETKTRTSRKIPIHNRLRPVLDEALAAAKGTYLFVAPSTRAYPDGGRQINRPQLNRQFQRLAEKLGMPVGRKFGFVLHSLRRFFESHAVNAGIPQRVIDTWLGHMSDKSMGAVYYRLRDEESQAFMQKVPFDEGPPATDAGQEVQS